MEFLSTPWHWLAAAGCAFVVGAAKTGIPGLGFLAVPWMAWIFQDQVRMSAGALLPMLCVADLLAVWIFRRNPAIHHLWHLLPWVLAGMGLGWLALHFLDGRIFSPVLGGIVLAMIVIHLLRKWRKSEPPRGIGVSAFFGVTAGTTTTIANAAGPVTSMYILSMRLPKEDFVAAGVWFFFIVNLAKLPIYGCEGMITGSTLLLDLLLVPAIVAGSLVGRRVLHLIPQAAFEGVVLALAGAGAVRLLIPH
jgi:uncharacterized membrane protein YfcA